MIDEFRTHGDDSAINDDEPLPERPKPDASKLFDDDRGPIGHRGRNSIPKSHRGEGHNFVD